MEEKIIIWLQGFSNRFLDLFFQGASYLVSWIGAIFVFAVIIFFVNKKYGFVLLSGFGITLGLNYLLKVLFSRPRPYVANAQIIDKLTTIGASFPSGHSVSAIFIVLSVLTLMHITCKAGKFKLFEKRAFKIVCYVVAVLLLIVTALARMYLGQHYLTDILGGFVVGALGFVGSYFVYKKFYQKSA